MKRISVLALALCTLLSFSCEKIQDDVTDLSTDILYFGAEGGTKNITIIKNFEGCSLGYLQRIEPFYEMGNYVPSEATPNVVEGEGIKVVLEGNIISVTVEPTTTTYYWQLQISGTLPKSIVIWQNKPKLE